MDDLLSRVERPSRYLGNEINAIKKDLAQVSMKVALAYPDLYEIGMSNTGLHILYHMLNEDPETACERVYLPAKDLEDLLTAEARALVTLENRVPLRELDVLGIQIPHELAYANIVKLLRLGQIPVWSAERAEGDPLVLGGGPGAFAPEVVAPFYDAILLGDAEEALWDVLRVVRECRDAGRPRVEMLARLAELTGVYVPSLYEAEYHPDGTLAALRPIAAPATGCGGSASPSAGRSAPATVEKALVDDLEQAYFPDTAIVPYAETVHNRLGIEVMRGCTVGCRFCQAGMIYRPLRERSPRRILDLAKCGLGATGFEDISLLSLDTGDYTLIDPLTKALLEETEDKRVALSLPSLRAGSLTDDVIRDIRRVRRTSFTIAPEAGSQRLRDVINKNISNEEIFETVERVAKNGWSAVKMYFMVGFPSETDEDLDGLVDLVVRCRDLGRRFQKRFNCTASIGTLVPKPWTPFQWDAQLTIDESFRRLRYVSRALRDRGVSCKYHDPEQSWLEGVFSRADRRLAPLVVEAEARGAGFESWNDRLDMGLWRQVFADHGVDPEWFLRERGRDELLPWDHLSPRLTKKYLLNDRKKVDRMANPTTFDCRDDLCSGCAVCFEGDTRNRLAKYHPDPFGDGRKLPVALTSRVAIGHGVSRQLEKELAPLARDQAAKAGEDALAAKLRRRRPKSPGKRRWAVTPGAPGAAGPAGAFDPQALAADEALVAQVAAREPRLPLPLATAPDEPSAPLDPERARLGLPPVELRTTPLHHVRLRYERRGDLRWLSHRELMRTFYRILTRCELPIHFTQGFHPKPKVAFGPPLTVGAESADEALDLYLDVPVPADEVLAALRALMPVESGLIAVSVAEVPGKSRSAHSVALGARWSVDLPSLGLEPAAVRESLRAFDAREANVLTVSRPGKRARQVDLGQVLARVDVVGETLRFDLLQINEGTAKPTEVAAALTGLPLERAKQGRFLLLEALRRTPPTVEAGAVEAPDLAAIP